MLREAGFPWFEPVPYSKKSLAPSPTVSPLGEPVNGVLLARPGEPLSVPLERQFAPLL